MKFEHPMIDEAQTNFSVSLPLIFPIPILHYFNISQLCLQIDLPAFL